MTLNISKIARTNINKKVIINEIIDNTYFNIKLTALKIKQAMNMYHKDAFAIMNR